MIEAVQAVLDPIGKITELYNQLIALGIEKQDAITKNNTDVIMQTTNRESKFLKEISVQEGLRVAAIQRFAAQMGMSNSASVRMEQLIQLVPKAALKKAMTDASDELTAVIIKLHDINERNQNMIRLQLEYINYSIDLIAGPSEDEATYHRSLQDQGFKRMSHFDTKA